MSQVWITKKCDNKNVHLQVSGVLDTGDVMIDWTPIHIPERGHLKLDSLCYALSDRIEVTLAWDKAAGDKEPHVFLPLNGRGKIDFDTIGGLENTVKDGKNGAVLLLVHETADRNWPSHFTLLLDFTAQGL